jgi:LysM repeat protein
MAVLGTIRRLSTEPRGTGRSLDSNLVVDPRLPFIPTPLPGDAHPDVPVGGTFAQGWNTAAGLGYTLTGGGVILKLPIAPDTANIQRDTRELAFVPIDQGDAPQPLGPNPKVLSFTAWCPGWCRKVEIPEPFVLTAEQVAAQLELWQDDSQVLVLTISGKYYPITWYCYIQSWTRKIGDPIGDEMINLTLKEYRPIIIRTEDQPNVGNDDALTTETPDQTDSDEDRPDDTPQQYTVNEGDSLWAIAQATYGDGSKWRDIYNANTDTISDPNSLQPGMLLTLPPAVPVGSSEVMQGVGAGTDATQTETEAAP